MKLYVLEERPQAEPEPPAPEVRRRFRVVAVCAAVAVLLVVGVLVLDGVRGEDPARAQPRAGRNDGASAPEHSATLAADPASTAQTPLHIETRPAVAVQGSASQANPAPPQSSSIVRKGDRILVDLHGVDIASALGMMSEATRATVVGAELLRDERSRLTATLTAPSRQSAWQSVFGGVANFAVSCVAEGCVVHIVSAVDAGEGQAHAPVPANSAAAQAGALDTNPQPEVSMAAAAAAVQRQQQTTYSEDY